jgi:hypothetical protein
MIAAVRDGGNTRFDRENGKFEAGPDGEGNTAAKAPPRDKNLSKPAHNDAADRFSGEFDVFRGRS